MRDQHRQWQWQCQDDARAADSRFHSRPLSRQRQPARGHDAGGQASAVRGCTGLYWPSTFMSLPLSSNASAWYKTVRRYSRLIIHLSLPYRANITACNSVRAPQQPHSPLLAAVNSHSLARAPLSGVVRFRECERAVAVAPPFSLL
jgi:hypothetical protein